MGRTYRHEKEWGRKSFKPKRHKKHKGVKAESFLPDFDEDYESRVNFEPDEDKYSRQPEKRDD